MRRKWELNVEDSSRWQYTIGEEPRRYYLRQSNFALNYQTYFIENFEDTFERKARIFEYGSGCTTIWWAINFPDNEIVSVEGNPWWYETITKELEKVGAKNVKLIYHPADENYTTVLDPDLSYSRSIEEAGGQFDLIINDGAQREMVGDFILRNADKYISKGGLYLRHDYEMAVLGNWVGLREEPLPEWCRDKTDLGYEMFCATHPDYVCTTITGNHIASMVIELGGVWRKADFKWIQRGNAEKKRLNEH
jgi:hypothetical protein